MKFHPTIAALFTALLVQACDQKSDSSVTQANKASPSPTRTDPGAAALSRAEEEWGKSWIQQDDKWITQARDIPFLFQIKGRKSKVDAKPLSEADRLNGVEWVGTVSFSSAAEREFWFEADPGYTSAPRVKGWNDWETSHQPIASYELRRKNRQWIFSSNEAMIPHGPIARQYIPVIRPKVSPLPK
ncbi:MAG: hypothetical protein QOF24_73 [Verrucomicrobiota bacterium]|jgi:hypothetical protein